MPSLRLGQLRDTVKLEARERVPDGGGGYSDEWAPFATVRAAVSPLTGGEAVAADQLESVTGYRVSVRRRPGLSADMRVRWGGLVLNVRAVIPPARGGRFVALDTDTGAGPE